MLIKKSSYKLYLLLVLIIYIFIFSDVGIISKFRLNRKLHSLEGQIHTLTLENQKLQGTIEKLKFDKNYLAERARNLGYAQKGEKIFRFYTEKTNITNTSKTNTVHFTDYIRFKDYYTYLILFLAVIVIYILLIMYNKKNN